MMGLAYITHTHTKNNTFILWIDGGENNVG